MEVHTYEVVATWAELFPDDELVVVGPPWTTALGEWPNVRVRRVPGTVPFRLLGQWVATGVIARALRADVLVSTSQVTSPLMSRSRRICTVHDWRHLTHP